MSKNKIIPLIFIVIVLVGLGLLIFYNRGGGQESKGIILFYGDGCLHCANVDKYIADNKVEDMIKFERLEVFNNKDNAKLLSEKAISCEIDISQGVIVPFLWLPKKSWDGKNCIVGDQDIIKYFQYLPKHGIE